MCRYHECDNEDRVNGGWLKGRCGENPGELLEKIKKLTELVRYLMVPPNGSSAVSVPDELFATAKEAIKGNWVSATTAARATVQIELHELGEKTKRLEAILGCLLNYCVVNIEQFRLTLPPGLQNEFDRQRDNTDAIPEEEDGSESTAPAEYQPDHATPPGDTIKEMMAAAGLSVAEAADKLNWGNVWLVDVTKGRRGINEDMAKDLGRVFDFPASFWHNLERNYRRNLDRLKDSEPATLEEDGE